MLQMCYWSLSVRHAPSVNTIHSAPARPSWPVLSIHEFHSCILGYAHCVARHLDMPVGGGLERCLWS